jgi:acetyl-CoA C-acetyltransferase
MGRLMGSLKDLSGSDLGAIAIRGALAKAGVGPELVEYVIIGQVLTAGAGQIPERQAAVAAGIPMGAGADDQQGVPIGDRCDRVGGSVDPGR